MTSFEVDSTQPVEERTKALNWTSMPVEIYVKIGVIATLFVIFFYKQIYWTMIHRWMNDSSWSHGFLIPLFSLYFLNLKKDEILAIKAKPNYFGWVLMTMSLVFYALNVVQIKMGILYSVLMIPMLLGIVLLVGGWKLIKHVWLPIIYIGFAIPIPDRIYKAITIPMRIWAAKIASGLLSLVSELEATSRGVIIDVVYRGTPLEPSLDVAEACSGMRLLMAFVALGVAMAWLHYRPWLHRVVLLSSTIPIAIFCNIIRVTVTGFIYVLIAPKYAQGIYHDILGMSMLPLAFGLYGLLAWFMSNLFVEDKVIEEDIVVRNKGDK